MISNSIVTPVKALWNRFQVSSEQKKGNLQTFWLHQDSLPDFVHSSQPAMRFLDLLGPLFWSQIPERNLIRNWGQTTIPNTAFLAACLIKLEDGRDSMGDLLLYLEEHPALIWLLGFPRVPSTQYSFGFDPRASLPTERHMARMLRQTPNATFQSLLVSSVQLLFQEFARQGIPMNDCISVDTKHILAWVKENNPKAYVDNRFNKTQQPKGDPDCKLGCKRKHNKRVQQSDEPITPSTNPLPANGLQIGEFYWGYGSGVVVVKVPDQGEFVLAELTQSFNHSHISSHSWKKLSKFWDLSLVLALLMPLLTPGMSMNTSIAMMIRKRSRPSQSLKKDDTKPRVAILMKKDYRCVPLDFPCHFCLRLQIELLVWLNMNAASMVVLYSFLNLLANLVRFIIKIMPRTKKAVRQ